jgi:SAM-dependent methyltransferase
LARIYETRFAPVQSYRRRIWQVLVAEFFQSLVPDTGAVFDLGCGYGEFINSIKARLKYAMDLNPNSKQHLQRMFDFIHQDCSARWPLPEAELDVIFTSNFFEHLPDKETLGRNAGGSFPLLETGR